MATATLTLGSLIECPGRARCPGCRGQFPSWTWTKVDGLMVLTHDGDRICPGDRSFGYTLEGAR